MVKDLLICMLMSHVLAGALSITGSAFGVPPSYIKSASLSCFGNESDLLDCQPVAKAECISNSSAGVACAEPCDIERMVRLSGGEDITEGLIEVCIEGFWGGVCDTHWCASAASVVCSDLGFSVVREFQKAIQHNMLWLYVCIYVRMYYSVIGLLFNMYVAYLYFINPFIQQI